MNFKHIIRDWISDRTITKTDLMDQMISSVEHRNDFSILSNDDTRVQFSHYEYKLLMQLLPQLSGANGSCRKSSTELAERYKVSIVLLEKLLDKCKAAGMVLINYKNHYDVAATMTYTIPLSHDAIKKHTNTIWNITDKCCYGKATKSNPKIIQRVNFLEGDNIVQRHWHSFIKMPTDRREFSEPKQFADYLHQTWTDEKINKNTFTGSVKVEAIYDSEGWIDYCSKNFKSYQTDGLLIDSSHFPSRR